MSVNYDLSSKVTDYGSYQIKAKSSATGYEDSDFATIQYDIGPTIAANYGVLTIVSVIQDVSEFKIYIDDILVDTVSYDYSASWRVDLSNYDSLLEDGKHIVKVCAVGAWIADNRSNGVAYFKGAAPIYGVAGLHQSAPALTRTDDAVGLGFAINSSSGTIASDFDEVFPFKNLQIVENTAGKFVAFPEMYFRIGYDSANRITDIAVSEQPTNDGEWYAVAPFMVGCYGMSVSSSRGQSKSGVSYQTGTRQNFRTYAANVGNNYLQLDLYHRTVLMFLWWIEFATKKSDNIMTGRIRNSGTAGGSSKRPCGGTDEVETPSGFETTYAQMRWHYIEDFIGNVWDFVDGVRLESTGTPAHVTANPAEFSDTTGGNDLCYNTAPSAWITAFGWDPDNPFLCMPIECSGGSDNTYFCDYHSAGSSSYPVLLCGARYDYRSTDYGLSYFNGMSTGSNYDNCGARLLCLL